MKKNCKKGVILFNPSAPGHLEPIIPYALLCISRYICNTYPVEIIVSSPGVNVKNEVIEKCSNAICLGITCITGPQIAEAVYIAKIVKDRYPGLPIVWGGWHANIMTEQTLQSSVVDIIVRGQGEITFTELIECLVNNGDLSQISGISYKRNGKAVHNSERPFTDINSFSPIPYHLINVDEFIHSGSCYCQVDGFGERSIDYFSSLGCPNNCQFCATPVAYKRRWYAKSPSLVIKELGFLKQEHGIDSVIMRDDNVFVNKKRVLEICRLLVENNLQINIGYADGTADLLASYTDEELKMIRRAGMSHVFIGVESGDEETLKLMRKRITPEQVVTVAKKCWEHDIAVRFSFMVGTPLKNSEMKPSGIYEDIHNNLNLMRKIDKECPNNSFNFVQGFYMPYPGSELYEFSKSHGFREPSTLHEWAEINFKKSSFVDVPKKVVSFANLIMYVLNFRLNSYRHSFKTFKDLFRYLFRFIATLRFKYNFYYFPIDFYIFQWWSKRSKKIIKSKVR